MISRHMMMMVAVAGLVVASVGVRAQGFGGGRGSAAGSRDSLLARSLAGAAERSSPHRAVERRRAARRGAAAAHTHQQLMDKLFSMQPVTNEEVRMLVQEESTLRTRMALMRIETPVQVRGLLTISQLSKAIALRGSIGVPGAGSARTAP